MGTTLQTLPTRSLLCSPAGLLPRLTLLPRLDCCLETQRILELRAIFISFGYIGLTSSPETSCSFSLRTTYSTHNVCSVQLLLLFFVSFLVDLAWSHGRLTWKSCFRLVPLSVDLAISFVEVAQTFVQMLSSVTDMRVLLGCDTP